MLLADTVSAIKMKKHLKTERAFCSASMEDPMVR